MTEPEMRPVARARHIEQAQQIAEQQDHDTRVDGETQDGEDVLQRAEPKRFEVEVEIFFD